MTHRSRLLLSLLVLILLAGGRAFAAERPNIVVIFADDMGYGDVRFLNPERGKIATPNLDRLASQSLVFTDGHSSSAVCTPSRYSLLTGRYNWRSRLQSGVLGGASPPLIPHDRLTLASLLKQQGYATAAFGKWHLGLIWATTAGKHHKEHFDDRFSQNLSTIDYTKPVTSGPVTLGFDEFRGITASLDMPPYVWIHNGHIENPNVVVKQFPFKHIRPGPASVDFNPPDVLPNIIRDANHYINDHAAAAKAGKPFFVYVALSAPHTPLVPLKEWQGKSGLGDYGDFMMEADDQVGKLLDNLHQQGLNDNTLVVFSSDNGCAPYVGVKELEKHGHYPSAQFRGYKADIFDGGHRIPFFIRWPGHVKPTESKQLVCLTDVMATLAQITGATLPDNAGEDSVSLLPILNGTDSAPVHEAVVNHSINGSFALRAGKWKLELCPDSGGWSNPKPGTPAAKKLPPIQLYDLSDDIHENDNVAAQHPDVVKKLVKILVRYVTDGRSTPGSSQHNDVNVNIWKHTKATEAQLMKFGN